MFSLVAALPLWVLWRHFIFLYGWPRGALVFNLQVLRTARAFAFQGFLSEKWSQKHLSDSIFLTSLWRLLRHSPAQVAFLRAFPLRPA
jgi:hypothetical protein